MAKVVLASALARWVDSDRPASLHLQGATLSELLDALFVDCPRLRGYVLDEHNNVRHHVTLFIDGQAIADKSDLSQPLSADSEIYIMQALSGG